MLQTPVAKLVLSLAAPTSYVNIGIKKGITGVKWNGTAKHDYRYVCLPVA